MKKLSISILLLMSCFLVTIVSTIAWFSAVRSSQTNGGSINLYKNEIVKNVTFHTCDTTYETDEDILPFYVNGSKNYNFGKYAVDSAKYQTLIRVELDSKYSSINLSVETSATYYQGEVDENGELKQEYLLKKTENSLTSIVDFYAFDESYIDNNTIDNHYNLKLNDTCNDNNDKVTFVNDTYTGLVEEKRILMHTFTDVSVIYIVVNYNFASIETIYSLNIGNDVIFSADNADEEGRSYISYDCDFNFYILKAD